MRERDPNFKDRWGGTALEDAIQTIMQSFPQTQGETESG